jgi:hypothetical protein
MPQVRVERREAISVGAMGLEATFGNDADEPKQPYA